ncbi:family 43 glycosylhydrolase [Labilibaculum manganireducens]|uniref:family 43 glycosylhydrolase n=1 Tax=Labilibaculum manganireducens TaxID=1940525 RepID=UPI0029F5706C|nr:family 43 glycosylhydrolase [Labilibaculum manganireducens]
MMNKLLISLSIVVLLLFSEKMNAQQQTFCNPMNLNYRFWSSSREAADPAMIMYKGNYLLFASRSGGYWYSVDMLDWKYVRTETLPILKYAPGVIAINDTVYYLASSRMKDYIYYSTNPFEDNWKKMDRKLPMDVWDPQFFQDDDGKVYLYWGCSNKDSEPIRVVELNDKMQPKTVPIVCIRHNPDRHGWEVFGANNETDENGFNEGAWMNKHEEKYYLQYASNGTEFKTYADGVYTSDSPTGPFEYETYSPFSYKPGGFIGGTGHSSTFQDRYGNYWHVTSLSIASRSQFERRLGLFPASFDKDGVLRTYTAFGDYPMMMPSGKMKPNQENLFAGWMLLSYNKKASVSSSLEQYPVTNAFDENVKTWWSAKTGNKGEWLSVELDDKVTAIEAIQINFADHEALLNPGDTNTYAYLIWASNDGNKWEVVVDRSNNTIDACHDYIELKEPIKAKYIKIENVKDVPGDGKFSVFDFRIFGTQKGKKPNRVNEFSVTRDSTDPRKATVKWHNDKSATGYVINYGTDANKLYTSVMVYDLDSVELTGLNVGVTYYFSIDAFNETGITKATKRSLLNDKTNQNQ